jgi:hypothetical protein
MNIWQYQTLLGRRLLQWSLSSLALGAFLMLGHPFWRGVGAQFVGWAMFDGLIAYVGGERARTHATAESAADPERVRQERRNLRALLWLNAALDLLYVRGGLWLALRRQSSIFTRGMGVGIVIQGGFLFLFDFIHALQVPDGDEYDQSV